MKLTARNEALFMALVLLAIAVVRDVFDANRRFSAAMCVGWAAGFLAAFAVTYFLTLRLRKVPPK